MMFPVVGSFANMLATGLGRKYEATATDNSATDLAEGDRAVSYAFRSRPDGAAADIVAAMTVDAPDATFRRGMDGRRRSGSIVWLQHRNASIQKLYPHVFDRHTALSGERYEASGTYYIGEWPGSLP